MRELIEDFDVGTNTFFRASRSFWQPDRGWRSDRRVKFTQFEVVLKPDHRVYSAHRTISAGLIPQPAKASGMRPRA